jgi:hypothetical protein
MERKQGEDQMQVNLYEGTQTDMHIPDMPNQIANADSWEVSECPDGHTVVLLLDDEGEAFAEAHIGTEEDVDHFIFALLGCCSECVLEQLEDLIERVKSSRVAVPEKS